MRRTPALSPKKAAQRCSIEKPITPEYVTRKQAASLLQCSDQLISKFIKVGKLRGFRLGTLWNQQPTTISTRKML